MKNQTTSATVAASATVAKAKAAACPKTIQTAITALMTANLAKEKADQAQGSRIEALAEEICKFYFNPTEAEIAVKPFWIKESGDTANAKSQWSRIMNLSFPKKIDPTTGKKALANPQEAARLKAQYQEAKATKGIKMADAQSILTGSKRLVKGKLVDVITSAKGAAGNGQGGHNKMTPIEEISSKMALLHTSCVSSNRMTSREFALSVIEWLKINGFDSTVIGIEFFQDLATDTVRNMVSKHTVATPAALKPKKPREVKVTTVPPEINNED